MRVDISKSNVWSKFGGIRAIKVENRVFHFVVREEEPPLVFLAENLRDARVKYEIDLDELHRAVQCEGYAIKGLAIERYKPANSDPEGVVIEEGIHARDLELVRDWQVRDSEDEPWTEWDRESKCWNYWRPASWAEAEEQEVKAEIEKPRPTPFSEEESAAVLSQIQSDGPLPWNIDLHLEALGLNYDQAQRALARRDPKTEIRDESGNLRPPWLENDPPQDLVYERLAQIANVPYDEAVTMASFPAWQETVKKLIQDQASADALKKYGIEIDWPASKYHEHARALADLVVEKQRQYGDSAGRSGKILAVLYPDGIPVKKYGSALLVVRVLDKLSRIATHEVDAGGEEPWKDIAGYALLALAGKP